MKNDRTLVIIPAYNEAEYIGAVITGLRALYPLTDILVVDDNSTDATAAVARGMNCVVLRHAVNLGDGASRQTGYLYAWKCGYEYAVHMDADGQHLPRYINDLLEPLKQNTADITIGSRFLKDTGYSNTFLKHIGVRFFNRIASFFTGVRITDSTSGFRAVNRKVMHFYCCQGFYPSRYPDADLIIVSHRAGYRIMEVAVEMLPNRKLKPLHHGMSIIYYVFKMLLSILVTVLREKPKGGQKP